MVAPPGDAAGALPHEKQCLEGLVARLRRWTVLRAAGVLLGLAVLPAWSLTLTTEVASVRIIPHSVQLPSNWQGTLTVELLDPWGYAITPDASMNITWTSADPRRVTVESPSPGVARLTAIVADPDSVAIAVSAGGKADTAYVRVLPAAGAGARPGGVSAPQTPLSVWNRLLRREGSGLWQGEAVAFRSSATVPGLDTSRTLSLFALGKAVAVVPPPGPAVAFVDGATPPGPGQVALAAALRVPVRIWNASDAAIDLEELKNARQIFALQLTGIELLADGGVGQLGPVSLIPADCAKLAQLFPVAYRATDPVVHVFYVSDLGGHRGYACEPDPAGSARAVLIATVRSPSTLAHELGHALGLWAPEYGHANTLTGYDQHNVMWMGALDVSEVTRSAFSLPQAFRLSVDAKAFVNVSGTRAAGLPRHDCRAQDVADRSNAQGDCPRLAAPTAQEQVPP